MAGSAGSIFVDLLLKDANYVQGLRKSRQETNRWSGQVQGDVRKTSSAFQGVINPVNNVGAAIAQIGGIVAASLSVQKIVQYNDAWTQLEGRLSLVVGEMGNIGSVQTELFDIAQRTRQPLEGVYNLYTRLAQAIPEAQRAQFDLLGVTESINQALAITGEGSAQAASAILQFTQAAASGFKGSGQEINALLDSAPRLAIALQRSFGDGQRSLKELSKEGELDLATILRSLSGVGEEGRKLREEFAKLPPTVGQAFTQLDNAFLQYIGQSGAVEQGTSSIVIAVQTLAQNLDVVANAAIVLSGIFIARLIPSLAGSSAGFLAATQQAFAYQIALARMAGVSTAAATASIALRGALAGTLALVGGPLGAAFLAAGAAIFYFTTQQTEAEKVSRQYQDAGNELELLYSKLTFASTARTAEIRKEIVALYDLQTAELQANKSKLSAISEVGKLSQTPYAKSLERTIEAQEKALRDFEDRALYNEGNRGSGQTPISAPPIDMEAVKKTQDEMNKLYQKNRDLILGLDKDTIAYQDTLKELNTLLQAGSISQDQYNEALIRAQDELDKTKDKVNAFGVDSEQFAKRAAENIQDAFADFLFDPFEGGLKGMAKGFVDTIRKMIAEAQAAKLAKALFGELAGGEGEGLLGGIFGSIGKSIFGSFSGGKADGGLIPAGTWGIVGEEGPELAFGGSTGQTIIPPKNMAGGGNTYNIDARGADQGAVVRLEQSLLALAGPGVIERRVSNAQSRGKI